MTTAHKKLVLIITTFLPSALKNDGCPLSLEKSVLVPRPLLSQIGIHGAFGPSFSSSHSSTFVKSDHTGRGNTQSSPGGLLPLFFLFSSTTIRGFNLNKSLLRQFVSSRCSTCNEYPFVRCGAWCTLSSLNQPYLKI